MNDIIERLQKEANAGYIAELSLLFAEAASRIAELERYAREKQEALIRETQTSESLKAELAAKDAEIAEVKVRMVRGKFGQICSYCGWESKPEGASWEELQAHIHECNEHPIAKLKAELAEAKRDAERYRWIRGEWQNIQIGFNGNFVDTLVVEQRDSVRCSMLDVDGFNEAIDAAIQGKDE